MVRMDFLNKFFNQITSVFVEGVFGLSLGNIAIILISVILSLVLRSLVARILVSKVKK